jgi:hypothetical protein
MRSGFDTSDPGLVHLTGFDVAGGYLGGNTPHVWTRQQWDDQPARWRAPLWTPWPTVDPVQQGLNVAAALHDLGAPAGCIVFLDMEGTVNAALVNAIAAEVNKGGYIVGVYGSESAVFGNPPRSGYWVALWDGIAANYEHPHAIGKQYRGNVSDKSGVTVDLSAWSDAAPLWDTRPVTPPALPSWAQSAVSDLNLAAQQLAAVRSAIQSNAH